MGEATIFHCYCTGVTQQQVLRALSAQPKADIEEIRRLTGACTGCQSCWSELAALIAAVREGRLVQPDQGVK